MDDAVGDLRLTRVPAVNADLEVAALEHRHSATAADLDVGAAPVRPGLDAPFELHLAAQALDAPREPAPRQPAAGLQVERLQDARDAALRRIRRLEDIRPIDVPAF